MQQDSSAGPQFHSSSVGSDWEIGSRQTSDAGDHSPSKRLAVKWEDNQSKCSLCGTSIGKLRLTPRHHCRICGLCVCAACSPSSVQLQGEPKLSRACNVCVADALRVPQITQDVYKLGESIERSFFGDTGMDLRSQSGNIDEALSFCEKAFAPMQEEFKALKATEDDRRSQLEDARLNFLRLGQKITSLSGNPSPYTWTSELQHANIDEAVRLCEEACESVGKQKDKERRRRSSARATSPRAPEAAASPSQPPAQASSRALLRGFEAPGDLEDASFASSAPSTRAGRCRRACRIVGLAILGSSLFVLGAAADHFLLPMLVPHLSEGVLTK